MRMKTVTVMALIGVGLSGCSLWTKSDKTDGMTHSDASLRHSPQQAYQFDSQTYDVDVYDAASASQYAAYAPSAAYSPFAGYQVELYNTGPRYNPVTYSDPRQSEFVMLNGESEPMDWQNCETLNRGYLYLSEYDFSLDPGFEVCMRNKGYVLTTEYNPASKRTLNAQTAGLRGSYQYAPVTSGYPVFFP